MRKLTFLGLSAFCFSALAGCAALFNRPPSIEAEIAAYERLQPNSAQLAAGDSTEVDRVRFRGKMLHNEIERTYYDGPATTKLHARVKTAFQAYSARASKLLVSSNPTRALEIVGDLLDTDDPALRESAAMAADALNQKHQAEQAERGTYRINRDATEKGRGSCAFARAPFGKEGTHNPKLAFRFSAADPKVYVRCYLPSKEYYSFGDRLFFASPEIGGWLVAWQGPVQKHAPYVDFTIDPTSIVLNRDEVLAKIQYAHMAVQWNDGQRLHVEEDGKIKIVPNAKAQILSDANFMWERAATVAAR